MQKKCKKNVVYLQLKGNNFDVYTLEFILKELSVLLKILISLFIVYCVNLWYFKLILFDVTEIIVWNIKVLYHGLTKI